MHQDTDGRHPIMKRKHSDENSMHVSQHFMNNQESQFRNNGYDRNSLPSGWLDCPAYGNEIGFIIPSKVPLGESFSEKISPGKRYTPREVIHQQRRLGREIGRNQVSDM